MPITVLYIPNFLMRRSVGTLSSGHSTQVSGHVITWLVVSMFALLVPLSLSYTTMLRGKSPIDYLLHPITYYI